MFVTVGLNKALVSVLGLKQLKTSLALVKRRCIGKITGMPITDNWLRAIGLENGALKTRLQEMQSHTVATLWSVGSCDSWNHLTSSTFPHSLYCPSKIQSSRANARSAKWANANSSTCSLVQPGEVEEGPSFCYYRGEQQ